MRAATSAAPVLVPRAGTVGAGGVDKSPGGRLFPLARDVETRFLQTFEEVFDEILGDELFGQIGSYSCEPANDSPLARMSQQAATL